MDIVRMYVYSYKLNIYQVDYTGIPGAFISLARYTYIQYMDDFLEVYVSRGTRFRVFVRVS